MLFLDNGDNAELSLNGNGNDVNYRDRTISETTAYFHLTEKYARAIEIHTLERLREVMNDGKTVGAADVC